MVFQGGLRSQSAVEYLTTYGWALVIIAVVLAALYQLGFFSGTNFITTQCLAVSGFTCQKPAMNLTGYVSVNLGQISNGTLTVTGLGCTNTTSQPSSYLNPVNGTLIPGQLVQQTFKCPGLSKAALGSPFRGYLWLKYNFGSQSGLVAQIAIVSALSSTLVAFPIALPNMYCTGGGNQQVYYSPLSNGGGITTWTSTLQLPAAFASGSSGECVTNSGYIYCFGGAGNSLYYAAIASTGGVSSSSWTATANFPIPLGQPACTASSGIMYCVGLGTGGADNAVYYAQLSSTGVGTWTSTGNYPIALSGGGFEANACQISGGYIYCVGGQVAPSSGTKAAYYAPVSSTGIGVWTPNSTTTGYPLASVEMPCSISGGYIYCMGGIPGGTTTALVYSAPISSTGFGSWTVQTSLPHTESAFSCITASTWIYCGPGYSADYSPRNEIGYAQITSAGTLSSWTSTRDYPQGGYVFTCTSG